MSGAPGTAAPAAWPVDDTTPRTRWALPGQVAGVWLAAVLGFIGTGWLAVLGFYLGSAGVVGVALIPPLLMFFLVGTLTRTASPLTRRPLPRLGWALLVTLLGATGAVFHLTALEALHPVDPGPVVGALGIGVPFALVAAFAVDRPAVRLTAAGLTAVSVALGIWLPTTLPPDDAASRAAHARVPGGVLVIATPDGYDFPSLTRRDGEVVLSYRLTGTAQPLSHRPELVLRPASQAPGDVRDDGLVHRRDAGYRIVSRRMDGVEIAAVVPDGVPEDAVRAFLLSARPATDEEARRLLPRAPDRRDRDVPARFTATLARLTG